MLRVSIWIVVNVPLSIKTGSIDYEKWSSKALVLEINDLDFIIK